VDLTILSLPAAIRFPPRPILSGYPPWSLHLEAEGFPSPFIFPDGPGPSFGGYFFYFFVYLTDFNNSAKLL
jgi:hypothetical protein